MGIDIADEWFGIANVLISFISNRFMSLFFFDCCKKKSPQYL